jgi:predicted Fe-Mo cluster-binding NifX family protein
VVVDVDTMEANYVDNGSSQSLSHGAGIQAAENIINAGASVLLTGSVGPKAFAALKAGGVKIGHNLGGKTVAEAVEAFKAGNVEYTDSPNR